MSAPQNALLSGLPSGFSNLFTLMEVAEEQITRAQLRYPKAADALNRAFILLTPSPEMTQSRTEIYRHHAAELLNRVGRGQLEGAELGTAAEVMLALHGASLKAPFKREPQVLYERLFAQLLPQHKELASSGLRESYPGAADELESELRRKTADPARKAFIKETLKTKLVATAKAKMQAQPLFENAQR